MRSHLRAAQPLLWLELGMERHEVARFLVEQRMAAAVGNLALSYRAGPVDRYGKAYRALFVRGQGALHR